MNVQAGRYNIELKELGWWDAQEIQSLMMSGAKMKGGEVASFDGEALMKAKMKTFEKTIVSIKEGETTVPFSESWVKGLTNEEGEVLNDAVDTLGKKK